MSSVPPPVIVRPSTSDLIGLRVVLDVQHAFRGGRHAGDRGARFRRADGATVDEIELALDYATAARRFLLQLGASVLTNNPSDGILVGSYEQRARVAEAWRADVYLACHVNAGAGAYSSCSYAIQEPPAPNDSHWRRVELASLIAGEIDAEFRSVKSSRTPPLKRGSRGWVCVGYLPTSCAAILVEPFFGDNPEQLLEVGANAERLAELGLAIARGVLLAQPRQRAFR